MEVHVWMTVNANMWMLWEHPSWHLRKSRQGFTDFKALLSTNDDSNQWAHMCAVFHSDLMVTLTLQICFHLLLKQHLRIFEPRWPALLSCCASVTLTCYSQWCSCLQQVLLQALMWINNPLISAAQPNSPSDVVFVFGESCSSQHAGAFTEVTHKVVTEVEGYGIFVSIQPPVRHSTSMSNTRYRSAVTWQRLKVC